MCTFQDLHHIAGNSDTPCHNNLQSVKHTRSTSPKKSVNSPPTQTEKKKSGDQIPVGVRFSAPVQTSSEDHPASYTIGTGSFPGIKWPGRGVDLPPPPNAKVKSRAIPLLLLWVFVVSYRVNFTFTVATFFLL